MNTDNILNMMIGAVAFSVVGIVLFGIVFLVLVRVLPFSLRKEIEEDQNVALGIVLGSIVIGISMIVSAAVHG